MRGQGGQRQRHRAEHLQRPRAQRPRDLDQVGALHREERPRGHVDIGVEHEAQKQDRPGMERISGNQ